MILCRVRFYWQGMLALRVKPKQFFDPSYEFPGRGRHLTRHLREIPVVKEIYNAVILEMILLGSWSCVLTIASISSCGPP